MSKVNSIMVGLDFSSADASVLAYTEFLSKAYNPKTTYLVNIITDLDIPDEVLAKYPELGQGVKDSTIEKIKKELIEFAPRLPQTQVTFDVEKGHLLNEFLEYVDEHKIDLVIAGRKKDIDISELMPGKLSRKVRSNILLVPNDVKPQINNILVTIDFSDNSALAFENALELAKVTKASIKGFHLYSVPTGYYTTGKSYQEFAEIMKGHAEAKYKKFISGFDTSGIEIEMNFVCQEEGNEKPFSDLVYNNAKEVKADLIVIGARGRTETAAVFLGSSTEELIIRNTNIPLLVVKDKDKEFGFWEAFKKLL